MVAIKQKYYKLNHRTVFLLNYKKVIAERTEL